MSGTEVYEYHIRSLVHSRYRKWFSYIPGMFFFSVKVTYGPNLQSVDRPTNRKQGLVGRNPTLPDQTRKTPFYKFPISNSLPLHSFFSPNLFKYSNAPISLPKSTITPLYIILIILFTIPNSQIRLARTFPKTPVSECGATR